MAFDAGDVEARLTLDRDPFKEGLRLARKEAQDFEKKTYSAKLKLNIGGRQDLTNLINRLNRLGQRVIRPKVRIDADVARLTITDINNRLNGLGRRIVRPRIAVSRNISGISTANVALNRLARPRRATISANVNQNSISRTGSIFRTLARGITGTLSGLSRALASTGIIGSRAFGFISKGGASAAAGAIGLVIQIGALTAAMGGLATVGIAVFGAITFAVGALTSALAAMPALVSAIGVPVVALMLGWEGVTKAAKVLEDEVKSLKKTLSDTLYNTTLPGFERLQVMFPIIEDGLNKIAERAGNFFTHMVNIATTEDNLDRIRSAFGGILTFMERMEGPIEHVFQSMLNIAGTEPLYAILGDTIGGVVDQIAEFFDQMLRSGQVEKSLNSLKVLLLDLTSMFLAFAESSVRFFTEAAPGVSELFKGIQEAVENIDFAALGRAWGQIAAALGEIFASIPPAVWRDIVLAFQEFADVLRDPEVQKGIIYLIRGLDDMIRSFTKMIEIMGKFLSRFEDVDAKVAESLELFYGFADITPYIWGAAWDSMTDKAGGALNWIVGTLASKLDVMTLNVGGFDIKIRGVWGAMWEWIKNGLPINLGWISDRIVGFLNSIEGWFQRKVDGIKKKWGELKDAISDPIRFVVEVIYNGKIVPVWNSIAGVFGMPKLSPVKFARGGVLPGYAPGVDSIYMPISGGGTAALSPGEGILVPEAVRGLGKGFVYWANNYFSMGRAGKSGSDEHYASGGIVDAAWDKIGAIFTNPVAGVKNMFAEALSLAGRIPGRGMFRDALAKIPGMIVDAIIKKAKDFVAGVGGAIGGASGPGGWQWQMAVLRSVFPGLQLISGFRPGAVTATGNRSYHAIGRAVDVPPRMDVFNFIRSTFGARTKELIFSPAGAAQIWNGRPHVYGEPTRGDHWDHVHWAYGKGGIVPPGTLDSDSSSGYDSGLVQALVAAIQGSKGTEVTVNASLDDSPLGRLVQDIVFAIRHGNKSARP